MKWSLCCCCGHSAKQRRVKTNIYAGGWLYPDLCDACYASLLAAFPCAKDCDRMFVELQRREKEFEERYSVTDFVPVIVEKKKKHQPRPLSSSYTAMAVYPTEAPQ